MLKFIKNNLTHKILPLLSLSLLILNLFFVSKVNCASTDTSINVIPLNSVFEANLKELPEYKSGEYYHFGFIFAKSTLYVVFIKKSLNPKVYCTVSSLGFDKVYDIIGYTGDTTGYINTSSRYVGVLDKQPIEYTVSEGKQKPYLSTNAIIYTDNTYTSVFYSGVSFEYPYIADTDSSLATLNGKYILIFPGSLNNEDNIKFVIRRRDVVNKGDISYDRLSVVYHTDLKFGSNYYQSVSDSYGILSEFWYEVLYSDINVDFKKDEKYVFSLEFEYEGEEKYIDREITIGSISENDKTQDSLNLGFGSVNSKIDETTNKLLEEQRNTQNAIDNQTEVIREQTSAIEENNKTNKNIFERIGEMLSYINPFSENFFAYKLIELIINALKSLFIPNEEFFSNYFSDLNSWFSDRFGFLYYPLELFFDLCNRFLNINFSDPIINIPNIVEPSTNVVLFNATSYNFNSLLEHNSLKSVHDIYLIIVDAIIYIGLVILLYNKYEEVMTK